MTAIHIATTYRDLMVDALAATPSNSGKIEIRAGTAPATANTTLSANTLLATIPLAADAYTTSSSGSATLNGVPLSDTAADATGTATFFRLVTSAGNGDTTGVILQGDVTATGGGGDMTLNSVSLVTAAAVTITGMTISVAA